MKIAFRQETSIDYPKKFGQILFTPKCNFRCGFCHNPELINGPTSELDLDKLFKDLKVKVQGGWYRSICISGGEPTLQEDLPEFVKKLKELGLNIKIDTNGSNPEMINRLLEKGFVDYVAMDIKSSREDYLRITNSADERLLEKIDKSIEIVKKFPVYEFRTTVLPFFTMQDFEEIGKWVSNNGKEKVRLYTIQQFIPKKTLDPKYEKMVPKTKEEIQEIAELMKKYSEEVRVLGI
ncbi:MAG: anaerobic ribonucleoside-triphosphate reductase activating protein [Candidatus Pacearchaeota archaeon]|jgi:pyruvate formate lyase activating enzyme